MTDSRVQVMLNRVYDLEMQLMENMPKAQLDAAGYVGYDSPGASALFRQYLANYQWREYSVRDDGTRDISGPVTPSGLAAVTRSISKGVEIEAVFNPTKNWRILLNVARQKAVRGETSALLDALIADRLPQWQNPAIWEFDLTTVQRVDNYVTSYITGPMTTAKLSNGEWTPELREWRVNLVTNYTFDRGSFLKGWGVGGAMRWEDKVGIGYPVIDNPADDPGTPLITDVKNPFMGPSMTTFDAWLTYRRKIWKGIDWKIQLNIRNLFNKNLFIPVRANPVTKNDINTYDIAAYRIGAERTYEITSTFSF
jgi:outer membrane receptor protein involved in Fe transport